MPIYVEKHEININHEYYKECDDLCFRSKNLYNATLYTIRQNYFNYIKSKSDNSIVIHEIENGKFVNDNYIEAYDGIINHKHTTNKAVLDNVILDKLFNRTNNTDFRALPSKVSKQVLIQVNQNYKSFFNAFNDYLKNPKKYKARPQIPNYKDVINGRNLVVYELNAINNRNYKKGDLLSLSGTNIKIKFINSRNGVLKQIRIVPGLASYNIEIVYSVPDVELKPIIDNKPRIVGIDLGVKNLMTICNNFDEKPLIINGGSIKSINQYSNKLIGKAKKKLKMVVDPNDKTKKVQLKTSKEIKRLYNKRRNKLDTELHCISKYVVDYLDKNGVNTCIIGHNKGWKQEMKMGKKQNQHFSYIPFNELISKIIYKALEKGITVIEINESYTSKCSFFDNESLKKHTTYVGNRIHRGLFITESGVTLNADVNASFNIIKKVVGDFKADIGQAVSPVKKNISFSL
jgi:putative transposase